MSVQNRGAGAEGAKESRPPHFEERFTAISEWRDCGVTGCDRGLRGPHLTHTPPSPGGPSSVPSALPRDTRLLELLFRAAFLAGCSHACLAHLTTACSSPNPGLSSGIAWGKKGAEKKRDNPPAKPRTPAPNPGAAV